MTVNDSQWQCRMTDSPVASLRVGGAAAGEDAGLGIGIAPRVDAEGLASLDVEPSHGP